MTKRIEPPKQDLGDHVYGAVKGLLGSFPIPIVSSVAAELFGTLVSSNFADRQMEFFEQVADKLLELEKKSKINIEELASDQKFTDVIMEATRLGLRTNEPLKKAAFKAIILNSALGKAPNLSATHIFLNLLDTFTDVHITMLTFFQNPSEFLASRNLQMPAEKFPNSDDMLAVVAPQPVGSEGVLALAYADLYNRKLVNEPRSNEHESWLKKATTPLADNFLRFIIEDSDL